jgi:hypothetical protein
MRKLSLAVVAAIAVVTALSAPSLIARAQSTARFEYLRVAPYAMTIQTPNVVGSRWAGYRACVAASTEWTCREFEHKGSLDALPTTLATLGNEGWELVSATVQNDENVDRGGLTYLFKRQRQ